MGCCQRRDREKYRGRGVFLSKAVVDCTSDGDIAWQSGVPFDKGNEKCFDAAHDFGLFGGRR